MWIGIASDALMHVVEKIGGVGGRDFRPSVAVVECVGTKHDGIVLKILASWSMSVVAVK